MPNQLVNLANWKQLVHLPEDALATCDIALVNLACTVDLPNAPSPRDIAECLRKLDDWAKLARRFTELSYD